MGGVEVQLPLLVRVAQRVEIPHKLGLCERLFGRVLARKGICWVNTAAGVRWKLDLRNVTHRWVVCGKYEGAAFLGWAREYLPRDGVVVDSGANIGQMLLYLAQWVPDGKVFAVEPGKHQADWLAECLAANPQLPVELIRVALGAERNTAFLENPGAEDRHGSWNRVSTDRGEEIDIVRLDDMLSDRGVDRVNLWKLDVEGHEIPALQGADGLLRRHAIGAIYVELDGDNGRRIIQYLVDLGYRFYSFSGSRSQPRHATAMSAEHTYGLFLPN